MRVELPSGNWVEMRDNLKGRDRTAVHAALRITVKEGQQGQEVGADLSDRMHDSLLANIITAWSLEAPIPAEQGGADAVADLDIDDYNELHLKTADLMKKVNFKAPN
jgi:hypothetical protein